MLLYFQIFYLSSYRTNYLAIFFGPALIPHQPPPPPTTTNHHHHPQAESSSGQKKKKVGQQRQRVRTPHHQSEVVHIVARGEARSQEEASKQEGFRPFSPFLHPLLLLFRSVTALLCYMEAPCLLSTTNLPAESHTLTCDSLSLPSRSNKRVSIYYQGPQMPHTRWHWLLCFYLLSLAWLGSHVSAQVLPVHQIMCCLVFLLE